MSNPCSVSTGVQLEDTGRSGSDVRTGTYNVCALTLLENEADPLHDCPKAAGTPSWHRVVRRDGSLKPPI